MMGHTSRGTQIKRVAVVATGVIGTGWVSHFLAQGLKVAATDPSPGAEDRLRADVARHWPTLEQLGLAPGASQDHLSFDAHLEHAIEGADFVQENGPEKIDIKSDLFRRLDAALPPEVILASSSSGLLVSSIQSACVHPERVVLGHPFYPPHLMPLVEVAGGVDTSKSSIERTMAFYRATGKQPIHIKKEIAGHIANRLQAALWREAFYLVEQGVSSVEDIDTAIASGPGLRWGLLGPFLNLHLSGGAGGIQHVLEHLGGPLEQWWEDLGEPRMSAGLKQQIAQGVADELGGRSAADVDATRDRLLIALIKAKLQDGLPQMR